MQEETRGYPVYDDMTSWLCLAVQQIWVIFLSGRQTGSRGAGVMGDVSSVSFSLIRRPERHATTDFPK